MTATLSVDGSIGPSTGFMVDGALLNVVRMNCIYIKIQIKMFDEQGCRI